MNRVACISTCLSFLHVFWLAKLPLGVRLAVMWQKHNLLIQLYIYFSVPLRTTCRQVFKQSFVDIFTGDMHFLAVVLHI